MTIHPATRTRIRTSQFMEQFLHRMERRLGGKLTQDELLSRVYRTAARVYADAMLERATADKADLAERKSK